MKYFLSTSKGFITQHLIKRLIELGHDVDAVGLNGVDSFKLRTNKYDVVVHLAATTNITQKFNEGIWYNNAVYAEYIMNNPFRTVYASSTSVYETVNPYAHSKAFLETLGERHGNALGLRFFNVYGPSNNKGIVKRVIDCCLSGEDVYLTGNGVQVRDFIYVDDVVDIILDHLDSPLSVMDVGTGIGISIYDLCCEIVRTAISMGITRGIAIFQQPSDLKGEQMESIAHSHPVKDYTPLREGIRKTIEETLKNR